MSPGRSNNQLQVSVRRVDACKEEEKQPYGNPTATSRVSALSPCASVTVAHTASQRLSEGIATAQPSPLLPLKWRLLCRECHEMGGMRAGRTCDNCCGGCTVHAPAAQYRRAEC